MTDHRADFQTIRDWITSKGRTRPEWLDEFFETSSPIVVARAPGRLDLMGGIADYSGSLVLQWPLREAALVAAQLTSDPQWKLVTVDPDDTNRVRRIELDPQDQVTLRSKGFAGARRWFQEIKERIWSSYPIGVLLVAEQHLQERWQGGLRILVRSEVPEAKGVSSSAALEVATLRALMALWDRPVEGATAAAWCQMAENLVVGAPCGIMDQMTSALGRTHQLLSLKCQPAIVEGFAPLPPSVGVWGIDSGIRHAVSGSDYTSVRTGAFMGYRMLCHFAGMQATETGEPGKVALEDDRWGGYLANVSPEQFRQEFEHRLPVTTRGDEFLARFGGITDPVTSVDPNREYAVRQPTAHPVYEHARVRHFRDLLSGDLDEAVLIALGDQMYASHESYSACGLGSDGTDRLVELVRAAGPTSGLYGAKITGGGSGGTVAVLGRADAEAEVMRIAHRYANECGMDVRVFRDSSPGAWEVPVQWIEPMR